MQKELHPDWDNIPMVQKEDIFFANNYFLLQNFKVSLVLLMFVLAGLIWFLISRRIDVSVMIVVCAYFLIVEIPIMCLIVKRYLISEVDYYIENYLHYERLFRNVRVGFRDNKWRYHPLIENDVTFRIDMGVRLLEFKYASLNYLLLTPLIAIVLFLKRGDVVITTLCVVLILTLLYLVVKFIVWRNEIAPVLLKVPPTLHE